MPDDQNKPFNPAPSTKLGTSQDKPSTIDDLVKELSRPQGEDRSAGAANNPNLSFSDKPTMNQGASSRPAGPPPNLPGVKIESNPSVSPQSSTTRPVPPQPFGKPPTPPLFKSSISSQPSSQPQPNLAKPQPFLPPKLVIPSQPLPGSAPKTLDGSVMPPPTKTVEEKPAGLAKPPLQEYKSSIRTMGEDISSIKSGQKPSGVDIPRKIVPEASRPSMPGIQKPSAIPSTGGGPMPSSIGLGRAEKTGTLPFTPAPKVPEIPKSPVIQPPVVVPAEKKGLLGFLSPTLYMFVAGILIVGSFMYWFFFLRVSEPEVVISPTPSPILTATPSIKSLSEIFGAPPLNYEISLNESVGLEFRIFVGSLITGINVGKNEFSEVNLLETNTFVPTNFLDMFDAALVSYPVGLKDNIADSAILVYGQSEEFNADGTTNLNVQDLKKTAFVARVKDKASIETTMRNWEFTMASELADFLLINDIIKEASVNFLDNTYRGVSIRYKNFPFPDVTVDYSIVDSRGQSYLVITGSREATYAAIDILLGQ